MLIQKCRTSQVGHCHSPYICIVPPQQNEMISLHTYIKLHTIQRHIFHRSASYSSQIKTSRQLRPLLVAACSICVPSCNNTMHSCSLPNPSVFAQGQILSLGPSGFHFLELINYVTQAGDAPPTTHGPHESRSICWKQQQRAMLLLKLTQQYTKVE